MIPTSNSGGHRPDKVSPSPFIAPAPSEGASKTGSATLTTTFEPEDRSPIVIASTATTTFAKGGLIAATIGGIFGKSGTAAGTGASATMNSGLVQLAGNVQTEAETALKGVSLRQPSIALAFIMMSQLQFLDALSLVDYTQEPPLQGFLESFRSANLGWSFPYPMFAEDASSCTIKSDVAKKRTAEFIGNASLFIGLLICISFTHVLVASGVEAYMVLKRRALDQIEVANDNGISARDLRSRVLAGNSKKRPQVLEGSEDFECNERSCDGAECYETNTANCDIREELMECRDKSNSAWLHFPHIELIFLFFVFQSAVTSEAQAIRYTGLNCPSVFFMAIIFVVLYPALMVIVIARVIIVRVLPKSLIEFRYSSSEDSDGNSMLSRIKTSWAKERSLLSWANRGRWRTVAIADKEKWLEGNWFRIGFEPLFVDFTKSGTWFVIFSLLKSAGIACVGTLVDNSTRQLFGFCATHIVALSVLVLLKPFANTIINTMAVIWAAADVLTTGLMAASAKGWIESSRSNRVDSAVIYIQLAVLCVCSLPIYVDTAAGIIEKIQGKIKHFRAKDGNGENQENQENRQIQAFIRGYIRSMWVRTLCTIVCHKIYACARDTRDVIRDPRKSHNCFEDGDLKHPSAGSAGRPWSGGDPAVNGLRIYLPRCRTFDHEKHEQRYPVSGSNKPITRSQLSRNAPASAATATTKGIYGQESLSGPTAEDVQSRTTSFQPQPEKCENNGESMSMDQVLYQPGALQTGEHPKRKLVPGIFPCRSHIRNVPRRYVFAGNTTNLDDVSGQKDSEALASRPGERDHTDGSEPVTRELNSEVPTDGNNKALDNISSVIKARRRKLVEIDLSRRRIFELDNSAGEQLRCVAGVNEHRICGTSDDDSTEHIAFVGKEGWRAYRGLKESSVEDVPVRAGDHRQEGSAQWRGVTSTDLVKQVEEDSKLRTHVGSKLVSGNFSCRRQIHIDRRDDGSAAHELIIDSSSVQGGSNVFVSIQRDHVEGSGLTQGFLKKVTHIDGYQVTKGESLLAHNTCKSASIPIDLPRDCTSDRELLFGKQPRPGVGANRNRNHGNIEKCSTANSKSAITERPWRRGSSSRETDIYKAQDAREGGLTQIDPPRRHSFDRELLVGEQSNFDADNKETKDVGKCNKEATAKLTPSIRQQWDLYSMSRPSLEYDLRRTTGCQPELEEYSESRSTIIDPLVERLEPVPRLQTGRKGKLVPDVLSRHWQKGTYPEEDQHLFSKWEANGTEDHGQSHKEATTKPTAKIGRQGERFIQSRPMLKDDPRRTTECQQQLIEKYSGTNSAMIDKLAKRLEPVPQRQSGRRSKPVPHDSPRRQQTRIYPEEDQQARSEEMTNKSEDHGQAHKGATTKPTTMIGSQTGLYNLSAPSLEDGPLRRTEFQPQLLIEKCSEKDSSMTGPLVKRLEPASVLQSGRNNKLVPDDLRRGQKNRIYPEKDQPARSAEKTNETEGHVQAHKEAATKPASMIGRQWDLHNTSRLVREDDRRPTAGFQQQLLIGKSSAKGSLMSDPLLKRLEPAPQLQSGQKSKLVPENLPRRQQIRIYPEEDQQARSAEKTNETKGRVQAHRDAATKPAPMIGQQWVLHTSLRHVREDDQRPTAGFQQQPLIGKSSAKGSAMNDTLVKRLEPAPQLQNGRKSKLVPDNLPRRQQIRIYPEEDQQARSEEKTNETKGHGQAHNGATTKLTTMIGSQSRLYNLSAPSLEDVPLRTTEFQPQLLIKKCSETDSTMTGPLVKRLEPASVLQSGRNDKLVPDHLRRSRKNRIYPEEDQPARSAEKTNETEDHVQAEPAPQLQNGRKSKLVPDNLPRRQQIRIYPEEDQQARSEEKMNETKGRGQAHKGATTKPTTMIGSQSGLYNLSAPSLEDGPLRMTEFQPQLLIEKCSETDSAMTGPLVKRLEPASVLQSGRKDKLVPDDLRRGRKNRIYPEEDQQARSAEKTNENEDHVQAHKEAATKPAPMIGQQWDLHTSSRHVREDDQHPTAGFQQQLLIGKSSAKGSAMSDPLLKSLEPAPQLQSGRKGRLVADVLPHRRHIGKYPEEDQQEISEKETNKKEGRGHAHKESTTPMIGQQWGLYSMSRPMLENNSHRTTGFQTQLGECSEKAIAMSDPLVKRLEPVPLLQKSRNGKRVLEVLPRRRHIDIYSEEDQQARSEREGNEYRGRRHNKMEATAKTTPFVRRQGGLDTISRSMPEDDSRRRTGFQPQLGEWPEKGSVTRDPVPLLQSGRKGKLILEGLPRCRKIGISPEEDQQEGSEKESKTTEGREQAYKKATAKPSQMNGREWGLYGLSSPIIENNSRRSTEFQPWRGELSEKGCTMSAALVQSGDTKPQLKLSRKGKLSPDALSRLRHIRISSEDVTSTDNALSLESVFVQQTSDMSARRPGVCGFISRSEMERIRFNSAVPMHMDIPRHRMASQRLGGYTTGDIEEEEKAPEESDKAIITVSLDDFPQNGQHKGYPVSMPILDLQGDDGNTLNGDCSDNASVKPPMRSRR